MEISKFEEQYKYFEFDRKNRDIVDGSKKVQT